MRYMREADAKRVKMTQSPFIAAKFPARKHMAWNVQFV
jgi:hypothetical protein